MNSAPKHILLGAGGAIGNPLAEELLSRNVGVKLVSRRGSSLFGAESATADLTRSDDVLAVVEEASTVYLLAGLPYRLPVWREQWPVIMRNTITACQKKHARLIFFDNVYMYGKASGAMSESTPVNPCSQKGEIRAQIAEMLLTEIKDGSLKGLVARSADFYGPHASSSSVPYLLILTRLAKHQSARYLVNVTTKHSYNYTVDCAKALYLLATADDAFNQVWHLPTASPAITGLEFIEIAARALGARPRYSILGKGMVRIAGLFDAQIRELHEMLYQNEFDYVFNSSKFEKRFNFTATPYVKGIEDTIAFFKQKAML